MFSVVNVLFLLDLSYLLFLCVEWCSFKSLVSGCVHVGGCGNDKFQVAMAIKSYHHIMKYLKASSTS